MSWLFARMRVISLTIFCLTSATAADAVWDSGIAENYSVRWKTIQSELAGLNTKLRLLPDIPIDDQGGTGGFASYHQLASSSDKNQTSVEIRWANAAEVDLVALIPARRYDAGGLDAEYGIPISFTVELLDSKGAVLQQVVKEIDTRTNPARRGHPFVYALSAPVMCCGLRITAEALHAYAEEGQVLVHAWSEALVFSGNQNIALGAAVKSEAGSTPSAPWHWRPAFLVDGETPLGLPEIPASNHDNMGWMSEARVSADQAVSLSVDLGEPVLVDAVRLIPAKRPTSDLPSGFGFPRKMVLSISDSPATDAWRPIAEWNHANPGHNPVLIPFPAAEARYFRIEAQQLWKVYDEYPAFFALSEVEIFSDGKNVALGKSLHSQDGMSNLIASGGRFWSSASLSDGFGPDGKLTSTREWMLQLDQRLRLETEARHLQSEAADIVVRWRNTTQIGFITIAVAGLALIIALPIRYRLQAQRELTQVRERIAGDLHDEVGSNLGSIQMIADLAEGRSGPSHELKRIQRIAAETVSAVRDIVWLLRPNSDHRIGTVEHLRETSSIMLETLKWKFTANEEAWEVELPEECNRDLFLYFREALHNIMRHAKAKSVQIHAEKIGNQFRLRISDDGVGIEGARLERPATFRALRQRASALNADFSVTSAPHQGTQLSLSIPLEPKWKH